MSIKKESNDWWSIENLEKLDSQFGLKKHLMPEDMFNDFGSYKEFNKSGDISKSLIKHHNDISPSKKIKFINRLISEVKAPNKILDLGCGCGFTSVEIANEFENAVVYGVDVSTDAINFARRNFQNKRLIFEKKSISCKFNNIDMYDIIFAIEFYPFSRSNDQFFQNSFIEYLSKHLENSGSLIIYQALTLNFYKNLKSIIRKNKYLNIKALLIPNLKVLDFLKSRPVAIAFCLILNLFFKRKFINIFVEIQNK